MDTSTSAVSARVRPIASWIWKALLGLAFTVAINGGTEWRSSRQEGPVYKGKTLSWWTHRISQGGRTQLSREDFQTMGPEAVNWLIWAAQNGQLRRDSDPMAPSRSSAEKTMHDLWRKLFHPRFSEGYNERKMAVQLLGYIGPDSAPAIPVLLRALASQDEDLVDTAAYALVAIGPAAWPSVKTGFRDGNAEARCGLVAYVGDRILGEDALFAGTDIDQYLDFVVKACADSKRKVRNMAALGLASARAKHLDRGTTDTVIADLIIRLSDPSSKARADAAEMIRFFGADGAAAVPHLIELLDDRDAVVRIKAVRALERIDRLEKRSKSRLQLLVNDPDTAVGKEAKEALIWIEKR